MGQADQLADTEGAGLRCGGSSVITEWAGREAVAPPLHVRRVTQMPTALHLRTREPELAPALAFFLRRQGCAADLRRDGTISVQLPHELHEKQAQMELELYVRLWEVLHGTRIEVLD
jgi:hypothetical protein